MRRRSAINACSSAAVKCRQYAAFSNKSGLCGCARADVRRVYPIIEEHAAEGGCLESHRWLQREDARPAHVGSSRTIAVTAGADVVEDNKSKNAVYDRGTMIRVAAGWMMASNPPPAVRRRQQPAIHSSVCQDEHQKQRAARCISSSWAEKEFI